MQFPNNKKIDYLSEVLSEERRKLCTEEARNRLFAIEDVVLRLGRRSRL